MRLLPSLGTLLYGWSAAAFDRRAETLSLDDEALVAMAAQGLKTYGLIDYLAFLAALEEGKEAQNIVPRSLRSTVRQTAIGCCAGKAGAEHFMPTTGRPSLSWDEYVMLVDACNVPSSSLSTQRLWNGQKQRNSNQEKDGWQKQTSTFPCCCWPPPTGFETRSLTAGSRRPSRKSQRASGPRHWRFFDRSARNH